MLTADEHGGFIEDGGELLILLLLASGPIFRSSSSERRDYVWRRLLLQNLFPIQQVVDLKPLGGFRLDLAVVGRVLELDLRRADLLVLVVDIASFDADFVAIGHLEICPFNHHGSLVDEVVEVLWRMRCGDVVFRRNLVA